MASGCTAGTSATQGCGPVKCREAAGAHPAPHKRGRLPPVGGGSREEADGTGERGREAARKAQRLWALDFGESVQEGTGGAHISCIIYNQEYTKCMWSEDEVPQINYTFFSKYMRLLPYSECSQYIQKEGHNTGCILEYNENLKFNKFRVNLSSSETFVQWEETLELKQKVLMNPPVNISVTTGSDNDINLTWNIPVTLKKGCLLSQVKYKNNKDVQWQFSPEIMKQTQFNLPFADESLLYEFYVKITVNTNCGGSNYWSDWSKPVYWGSNKSENKQFYANTDCRLIVFLNFLKDKLELPRKELIDLCDESGNLMLLFLCKNQMENTKHLVPGRCTFIVCRIASKNGTHGG
ncbi:IL2RG protein, partial [Polypterus senegalus]